MVNTNKEQNRPTYIKRVEVIGIFNRFDIILDDLQPGINILHGDNGSGKTTVLHILANALSGDYGRFLVISFNYIKIIFDNGLSMNIYRLSDESLILERSDFERKLRIYDGLYDKATERKKSEIKEYIDSANSRARRFNRLLEVAYFPAFRSMIEAWNLLNANGIDEQASSCNKLANWQQNVIALSRRLFGEFVPSLNYFSPSQIEKELFNVFKKAKEEVLHHNQEVLSKSFRNILSSFDTSDTNDIETASQDVFQRIKKLSKEIVKHPLQGDINFIEGLEERVDKIFSTTKDDTNPSMSFALNILKTYQDSLQEIVDFQDKLFNPISTYLDLVNTIIKRKKVNINLEAITDSEFLILFHLDGTSFGGIQYLSSGEKQVLTLLYAATHISSQDIILIDEPEISIHIDTQIELLKSLSKLVLDKQVIVCTYSPTIAGEEIDRLKSVDLLETDLGKWVDTQHDLKNFTDDDSTEFDNGKIEDKSNNEDEDFGAYGSDSAIDNIIGNRKEHGDEENA